MLLKQEFLDALLDAQEKGDMERCVQVLEAARSEVQSHPGSEDRRDLLAICLERILTFGMYGPAMNRALDYLFELHALLVDFPDDDRRQEHLSMGLLGYVGNAGAKGKGMEQAMAAKPLLNVVESVVDLYVYNEGVKDYAQGVLDNT